MPRVIITVQNKNPQPYRFQLDHKVVSLGRGSDNDIVIDSGSVSGKHAEMHRVAGGYELADLGSTNGIKIDDTRLPVINLRSGMSVQLGDVDFEFALSDEELVVLEQEKNSTPVPMPRDQGSKKIELPKAAPPIEETSVEPDAVEYHRQIPSKPLALNPVLFLILASAAFYAGLEVRHKKDTGESLLKGIVNKSDVVGLEQAMPPGDDAVAE